MSGSKWMKGPEFLWERDIPFPQNEEVKLDLDPQDPELKKAQVLCTSVNEAPFELDRFRSFSSWFKLKRAVALCLRFKFLLRQRLVKRHTQVQIDFTNHKSVTVEELREAELDIIRLVQSQSFKEEFHVLKPLKGDIAQSRENVRLRKATLKQSSSVFRLDPFIDRDGILRVGGRLRLSKFPEYLKHLTQKWPCLKPDCVLFS